MTAQAEILSQLEDKQRELLSRIQAIETDFKNGRAADFAEQATETENDQVLDEIHHQAKEELLLVIAAIAQINNGHYGQCKQCAAPIEAARLTALPYVQTCIHCAQ